MSGVGDRARGLTADMLRIPGRAGSSEDRFWARVQRAGPEECWSWRGRLSSRGYGSLHTPYSSSTPAHRVSYVLHHGPVLDGLVVDHVCQTRTCVNPRHLRAVTPKQNTLENSFAPTAINAAKTHCVRGHPLSGDNVRQRGTWRMCKACQRDVFKMRHAEKKAHLLTEQDKHNG